MTSNDVADDGCGSKSASNNNSNPLSGPEQKLIASRRLRDDLEIEENGSQNGTRKEHDLSIRKESSSKSSGVFQAFNKQKPRLKSDHLPSYNSGENSSSVKDSPPLPMALKRSMSTVVDKSRVNF